MKHILYTSFTGLALLTASVLLITPSLTIGNAYAQDNNNATPNNSSLTGFSQVSAGENHSLGISEDKKVYAWGTNTNGRLGQNQDANPYSNVPVPVVGLPEEFVAVSVAAGGNHSLALGENGELYAWGDNSARQLNGRGPSGNVYTPILVNTTPNQGNPNDPSKIIKISAGNQYSLAVREDGIILSWGSNNAGQIGVGSPGITFPGINTVRLPDDKKFVHVDAGFDHSIALDKNGQAYTWGNITDGKLGHQTGRNPALINQGNIPTNVNLISATAGANHSLAIGNDGQAYAWGSNNYGQLGDDSLNHSSTPITVRAGEIPTNVNLISATAGANHSLAIGNDGQAYAWGSNNYGQLGDDSLNHSSTPITVRAGEIPTNVNLISATAGANHSLAIGNDGQAYAWGSNNYGQLGDASTMGRKTPVLVNIFGKATQDLRLVRVSAGFEYSAGLGNDGNIYTVGSNKYGQLGNKSVVVGGYNQNITQVSLPDNVQEGFQFVSVAAGIEHVVATGSDGKIYTWGNNVLGQLGHETEHGYSNTPGLVDTPVDIKFSSGIAAGTSHSVAIGTDESVSKVYTWGHNGFGQLGRETELGYSLTPEPVDIPAGVNVGLNVAAGGSHSLAINSAGEVYSWGDNHFGQLGNNSNTNTTTPVLVNSPSEVKLIDIVAGKSHSLALGDDGKAYAWGADNFGQLGQESVGQVSIPSEVSFPENVSANFRFVGVSAGDYHSFGVGNDSKAYAWGANQFGQLGIGNNISVMERAFLVVMPKDVVFEGHNIAAGGYHSLAADNFGNFYTWGDNSSRQLGRAVNNDGNIPVIVEISEATTVLN